MRIPTLPRRVAPAAAALALACGSGAEVPLPADPVARVAADSAAILQDLRYLSSDELGGRASGSEGAARARAHLLEGLRAAGVEPVDGVWERPFSWAAGGETREGVNLVGVLRGTEAPERHIVLSAHYDHLGVRDGDVFNGADDNASGAAALLAIARGLRGTGLRHSVLFVAFDAEEAGLRGARAFVEDPAVPLDRIAVNVNLDMVARTDGLLWAAGASHTPELRPVLEGVAAKAPVELRLGHDRPDAPEGDDWTRSSDHAAFHAVGIPFVYFGVEDHPDYHRATDDFENVAAGEYLDAVRTVLLALLALDEALPLRTEAAP